MTQVKLCGIRAREIAEKLHDSDLKPDFVGFVFAKSRRQVTLEDAAVFSNILGDQIQKVGVFVNSSFADIAKITEACHLDIVQLHGQESPEICKQLATTLQIKVWKAFSVKTNDDFRTVVAYQDCIHGALLDTYDANSAGGTGKSFDWTQIDVYRECVRDLPSVHNLPIVIAGGIREQNVQDLIQSYHPDVIDVSSGIEAAEGTQDFEKMISLLKRVNSL